MFWICNVVVSVSGVTECKKNEELGDIPDNIYFCEDDVKHECCEEEEQFTCCEPKDKKTLYTTFIVVFKEKLQILLRATRL